MNLKKLKLAAFSAGLATVTSAYSATVTDDYFDETWALKQTNGIDIQAEAAWEMLAGVGAQAQDDVVVAVIGTGVDHHAPDLQGRLVSGVSGSSTHGYANMVLWNNDAHETIFNHETIIAHQISAAVNGSQFVGVAGEFPVKVLPIKTVGDWEDQFMDATLIPFFLPEGDYYYKDCEAFAYSNGGVAPNTCLKSQLEKFFQELDAPTLEALEATGGTVAIFNYYGVSVDLGVCGSFYLDLNGLHGTVNDCYELISTLNEEQMIEQLYPHWANSHKNPLVTVNRYYHALKYAIANDVDIINISLGLEDYDEPVAVLNLPPPVVQENTSVFKTTDDGRQVFWSAYDDLLIREGDHYTLTADAYEHGYRIVAQGLAKEIISGVMDELKQEKILVTTPAGNSCTHLTHSREMAMPSTFAFEQEVVDGQYQLKYPNVLSVASISSDGALATDAFTPMTDSMRQIYSLRYPGDLSTWNQVTHIRNDYGPCAKTHAASDHSNYGLAHIAAPGADIFGPGFNKAAAQARYGNWYNVIATAIPAIKAQEVATTSSGTSLAAPLVAGALAMGMLADPDIDPLVLRDRLLESATPTDQLSNWNVATLQEIDGSEFGQTDPVTQLKIGPLLKPIRATSPEGAGSDWSQLNAANWETGGYLNVANFLASLGLSRNGYRPSDYPNAGFIAYDKGASVPYIPGLPRDITVHHATGLELIVELQPSEGDVHHYDVLLDGELHATYMLNDKNQFVLTALPANNHILFSASAENVACHLASSYVNPSCQEISIQFDGADIGKTTTTVEVIAYNSENAPLTDQSSAQSISLNHQYPFVIDRNEVWFLWAMWVKSWNMTAEHIDYYVSNSKNADGSFKWKLMWQDAWGVYYLKRPEVGGRYIACLANHHPTVDRHLCSNEIVRTH